MHEIGPVRVALTEPGLEGSTAGSTNTLAKSYVREPLPGDGRVIATRELDTVGDLRRMDREGGREGALVEVVAVADDATKEYIASCKHGSVRQHVQGMAHARTGSWVGVVLRLTAVHPRSPSYDESRYASVRSL